VAEDLLGWTQPEAVGRPLPEIFRTFDGKNPRKEINPLHVSFAEGSRHVVTDNVRLVSRDGREHILSTSFGPIRDQEGSIIGGVLVFRDNTERKRIEERLLNAQKLESIGVLAGGIAHDFNNLLSAILGNISLAKAKRDETSFERLEEIEKASMRAEELTRQLLTFSKGGSPVKKTASIVELIRQSAMFVATGSNVRCEFQFAGDLLPVDADPGQLSQVINNLVINAMQAMPNGGVVRISAENIQADAGWNRTGLYGNVVKVSVQDEGPGIPAEHLSRIFDPYFTTKEHGSGLGLATVYSIIKRHDGQIEVESRPGAGTTFHLFLPASEKPLDEPRATVANPRNGKGCVLVMDDEEFIRGVARDMLGHLGYSATCARDGAEAVELYKKSMAAGKPFDAVIMDLTVPGGMGGKDAVRILKEIDPGIMAIVSSGYSNDPILADPGKFGFTGIVAKPYTLDALSDAVYRVVHGKRESA
jgi:PAS domain S-box-containing protein